MAAPASSSVPVGPDTLITVKVLIDGTNRRFKLALRDLGAHSLPQKLRFLLAIPAEANVLFERFSDSAGSYVALDSNNPAIYKQLYRAAKAKLKLRIQATVTNPAPPPLPTTTTGQIPSFEAFMLRSPHESALAQGAQRGSVTRNSYLDTVLSPPPQPDLYTHCPNVAKKSAPMAPVMEAVVPPPSFADAKDETLFPKLDLESLLGKDLASIAASAPTQDFSLPSGNDSFGSFSIDCNSCGELIPNEHYHCGICDKGDFDLCLACVGAEITCNGASHWLIKRKIQNGRLVTSVTERIDPKKWQANKADSSNAKTTPAMLGACRTCNSCIRELPEKEFMTCLDCNDFDLCKSCFLVGGHGHHPVHRFKSVIDNMSITTGISDVRSCEAGYALLHAAVCDGCDQRIWGVRHKCLSCPDWDYCTKCVASASEIHPGHRFAALYEEIPDLAARREDVHYGIWCDGPLCVNKSGMHYIRGTRYKCTVCNDTDFCAGCEALPVLHHNRTHPLIKFKSPVRHVSVTTREEKNNGESVGPMGDRPAAKNAATETTPTVNSVSAATEVQTVVEVKPAETIATEKLVTPKTSPKKAPVDLQALFEWDTTPDGSEVKPDSLFFQAWTLRNPGPDVWPAGCAVSFTGGDHMLNVDSKNPSSVSAMSAATRSNVIVEPVYPNQKVAFTVLLKSPEREGRAISYWRLKTQEGVAFGHKLWVDITVTRPPVEIKPEIKAEHEVKIKEEKSVESSTMIFPKLEKESPVSSIHGLEPSKPSSSTEAEVKDKGKAKVDDLDELAEDLESLEFEDEEETDDGFLTDEEYDILDASDEELLLQMQATEKK